MVMLLGIIKVAMQQMESFWCAFRDLPLLNALITPVLSPQIVTRQSLNSRATINSTASSRATDSAQPISLPPEAHLGVSFHAAHWCPIMSPMPQFVEVSTQMSGSTDWCRVRDRG